MTVTHSMVRFAEVHFVSGTRYDATTFGQLYNDTWIPKEVTLTTANYGSDGFHLDFADASAKVMMLVVIIMI